MKKVLIAGGTGLIGTRLSALLTAKGYEVALLSRKNNPNSPYKTYTWQPEKSEIDTKALENTHFVINLAGAGIADKRWTPSRKKLIIDSRTESAAVFSNFFSKNKHSVEAYIAASAIGYYGNRGAELMTEDAAAGKGFLTESTVKWEEAIQKIADTKVRTVALRVGVVLSTEGGAFPELWLPYRFGGGAYFGDGAMYLSWIHIDDICNMFIWALENTTAQGIYNGVAPQPVTSKEFAKILAKESACTLVTVPVPAFGLRVLLGEMSDVVLNSTRVSAEKIQKEGFKFQFTEAAAAVSDIRKRKI